MQALKTEYCWYALYVKVRSEKKVKAGLEQRGIECFLPLKTERRKWSDRVKEVQLPLLTGYVFVRVSNKEYFEVLKTNGVVRYVCFEGQAAVIPDHQIESLRIFMEKANTCMEITTEHVRKGTEVRIVEGPLAGVVGEVVEIRGKTRILLRFVSLGYSFHVEQGVQGIALI